ncbi:MAG TPA: LysE family transporter [Bordetella sp.]
MLFSLPFSALFGAWFSGAATGLGLFAAVGAQSAYILRQGILRAHLLGILAVCALLDATFIFASVLGLRMLDHGLPWLTQAISGFGVAFLAWYALQAARRALRPGQGLQAAAQGRHSRRAALLGAVSLSLFNPHFWLDIMVVGSLAHGLDQDRLAFGAGAMTASLFWLAVLGLGSRLFAPLFAAPRAWRVLDGGMAVLMSALALKMAAAAI